MNTAEQLTSMGINLQGHTHGQISTTCPQCSKDRKKKNAKPLSVNTDDGVYHCHHCGWKGKAINENSNATYYDYKDERGNLIYQSVRFCPKDFRQRRPIANNQWEWNLKGIKPLPYRLPGVLQAIKNNQTVYVVEGEKDADRLHKSDLTATCNSGGAGKWKAEHSQYLKGAAVVIIPDNDEPGERHAQIVAESLQGIANSIKILSLPDLPNAGDVSDYLKTHTIDELKRLVKDCPQIENEKPKAAFIFTSIDEYTKEIKPPECLIEGYLEKNTLGELYGDFATYKSFQGIDMGLCTASGKDWHGVEVEKAPVFYICGEGHNGIKKRLKGWCIHNKVNESELSGYFNISEMTAQFFTEKDTILVKQALEQHAEIIGAPPGLIILDTFARNFGGSENSNDDVSRFVNNLDSIRHIFGCTFLVVHHKGHEAKARSRGASAFPAACDFRFDINRPNPLEPYISLTCTKQKDSELSPEKAFKAVEQFLPIQDKQGRDLSTLVLKSIDIKDLPKPVESNLGKTQQKALSVLAERLNKQRKNLETGGYPPDTARVLLSDWKKQLETQGVSRQQFYGL